MDEWSGPFTQFIQSGLQQVGRPPLRCLFLLAVVVQLSACGSGEPFVACASSGRAPVVLVWDSVAGANGYRIYHRTEPGGYLQNLEQGLDVGDVSTHTVAGLTTGMTYHFAVTAYGSNGESDFSNEACQTIVG